jgi:hypothetical protein
MSLLQNSNAISSGGYDINNSLRFRASASAYLNRTPASAGNRKTWTWSAWVKRGTLGTTQRLFCAGSTDAVSPYETLVGFNTLDQLLITINGNGATGGSATTSAVFRDPSAWYHIVGYVDMAASGQANKVRIYVNGNQQAVTYSILTTTDNTEVNNNVIHRIGANSYALSAYFDGYMTELNFIDGQALTPSSFGETDTTTGSWKPKAYTGTYGTNGFYLKFSDIATTSGSNAGLGKDFSGNTNYWTTNNISVTAGTTYDAMLDVPTNTSATVANYAVINPLDMGANITISDGNLKFVSSSSAGVGTCRGSMAFATTGKWYFEVTAGSTANANTVGVANLSMNVTTGLGANANGWGYTGDGFLYNNNSGTNTSVTWGNGDVIGIAFDADTGRLWFAKNNTWVLSGNPSSNTNPAFTGLTGTTFFPAVSDFGGASISNLVANFGQRPFSYTPPTGFVRLNTFNLPDSTIKKGNTVMDATLYTGNGSTQTITNASPFKPDFVWIKSRAGTNGNSFNLLYDSVRGAGKFVSSNTTNAEAGNSGDLLASFNSNGFSVNNTLSGASNPSANGSGTTFVGWQWQAGQGSTSSNTSGTITSTVSVNATAGFSVVTFNAAASGAFTVGHGLGVAPRMIITRYRNIASESYTYHASVGNTQFLKLNDTSAATTNSNIWNNTSPTSTVFTLGSSISGSTSWTMVAYCWAEIAGFSRFGSYTGNGSADGPFIFTGFRPKYVMVKSSSNAAYWIIEDSTRNPSNVVNLELFPNDSLGETNASRSVDFLSNGFKLRHTDSTQNSSGWTYIYMAFAENPLKNSNAR